MISFFWAALGVAQTRPFGTRIKHDTLRYQSHKPKVICLLISPLDPQYLVVVFLLGLSEEALCSFQALLYLTVILTVLLRGLKVLNGCTDVM